MVETAVWSDLVTPKAQSLLLGGERERGQCLFTTGTTFPGQPPGLSQADKDGEVWQLEYYGVGTRNIVAAAARAINVACKHRHKVPNSITSFHKTRWCLDI